MMLIAMLGAGPNAAAAQAAGSATEAGMRAGIRGSPFAEVGAKMGSAGKVAADTGKFGWAQISKMLGGGKGIAGGGIGILLGLLLGSLLKETVAGPQQMQTQADLALSGQPPPELIAGQAMAPQMQSQNDMLFRTLMQQMGGSGGITPQEMAL